MTLKKFDKVGKPSVTLIKDHFASSFQPFSSISSFHTFRPLI
ncbi:Uncharacterized protein APZ42_004650 [Daphnia magna]|uniref:Uncharacterized protein n=1 Tax=Daphnia magna TaxID=35525 RepID=A0A164GX69_9CRUS|nr:Uncharacterized protein APZ42_004650 [Daphnia magna]